MEWSDRCAGIGSCENSMTAASMFVSRSGYTGVSSYLGTFCSLTCAGNALGMAKGASAVRLAMLSKSESGAGDVLVEQPGPDQHASLCNSRTINLPATAGPLPPLKDANNVKSLLLSKGIY